MDEAIKVEDFRSTYEADKGSFLSGDEYFSLCDEESTPDNSGNRRSVSKVHSRSVQSFCKVVQKSRSAPAERLF